MRAGMLRATQDRSIKLPKISPSMPGVSCLTEMIRIQNIERKLDDIDRKIDDKFEWLRRRIDEIQAQLNRIERL